MSTENARGALALDAGDSIGRPTHRPGLASFCAIDPLRPGAPIGRQLNRRHPSDEDSHTFSSENASISARSRKCRRGRRGALDAGYSVRRRPVRRCSGRGLDVRFALRGQALHLAGAHLPASSPENAGTLVVGKCASAGPLTQSCCATTRAILTFRSSRMGLSVACLQMQAGALQQTGPSA